MRSRPAVPVIHRLQSRLTNAAAWTAAAAVGVAMVGALVGCSSSSNALPVAGPTSSIAPSTAPVPTVSAPVTVPDTTTAATTDSTTATTATSSSTSTTTSGSTSTTSPPSTTNSPPAAPLRIGGFAQSSFGDAANVVLPALTATLGKPTLDEVRSYPTLQADGTYLTADGEFGYTAPKGREVCWRIGFCADFGGSNDRTFEFTGWSYGSDATKALRSRSGVSIGTRWSEVPRISLGNGVCSGLAPATVDGITLQMQSTGAPFDKNPHHEDVTVFTMTAGDVPQFQFSDC